MNHNFKCFDKIQTTADWVKFFKEFNSLPVMEQVKLGDIDCWVDVACKETEKAWCFDYTALYKKGECGRRFYYAPKSKCKVITNNYYINKDGSFQEGTHVLVPAWITEQFI